MPVIPQELGKHVRRHRKQAGMALRQLAQKAGMSPAALSAIERGESSPTLGTLHKVLLALDTDFATFFSNSRELGDEPIFHGEEMRVISDKYRKYIFPFPKRKDIQFEATLETISPLEKESEWDVHKCDIGVAILAGGPAQLEIENKGSWRLKRGDAFYVKASLRHRAINLGKTPLKIFCVFYPPRY